MASQVPKRTIQPGAHITHYYEVAPLHNCARRAATAAASAAHAASRKEEVSLSLSLSVSLSLSLAADSSQSSHAHTHRGIWNSAKYKFHF